MLILSKHFPGSEYWIVAPLCVYIIFLLHVLCIRLVSPDYSLDIGMEDWINLCSQAIFLECVHETIAKSVNVRESLVYALFPLSSGK